jgi:hypothetical protein
MFEENLLQSKLPTPPSRRGLVSRGWLPVKPSKVLYWASGIEPLYSTGEDPVLPHELARHLNPETPIVQILGGRSIKEEMH